MPWDSDTFSTHTPPTPFFFFFCSKGKKKIKKLVSLLTRDSPGQRSSHEWADFYVRPYKPSEVDMRRAATHHLHVKCEMNHRQARVRSLDLMNHRNALACAGTCSGALPRLCV